MQVLLNKWSSSDDIKAMTVKTEMLLFDFRVKGNNIGHNLGSIKRILIYYTIGKGVVKTLSARINIRDVHREYMFLFLLLKCRFHEPYGIFGHFSQYVLNVCAIVFSFRVGLQQQKYFDRLKHIL